MSKGLKILSMFVVSMIGVVAAVVLSRTEGVGGGVRRKSATGRAGRAPKRSESPSYRDMTRAELYELAREQDIPQRSKMTRDELAEALGRRDA